LSPKLSKKIYLNDKDQVVDRSEATCWFADLLDENGSPVGELFGLVIRPSTSSQ
jgi:hypothetical protein